MGYKYQAQATRDFGIEFRSQLEAKWAYEFTNKKQPWEYTDSHWHDFVFREFDSNKVALHLEVKPLGGGFLRDALHRAWPYRSEWNENDRMAFVLGDPDECLWCIASVLNCGNCASLSFSAKGKSSPSQLAWNPEVDIYGGWCEHGVFIPAPGMDFYC